VVVVDGRLQARGEYRLRVERDSSTVASIRDEQSPQLEALCKAAGALRPGFTGGTFESLPGGARASCGGTGGGSMHRVHLDRAATLRIVTTAQFVPVVEVRPACRGAALGCVAAERYEHDVAFQQAFTAGDYFLVVDAANLGDPATGIPGAAVRGAYTLDVSLDVEERRP
jgi:hypothetical protein